MVQQPMITKGSQISPFLSKQPLDNQLYDYTNFVWEVLTLHGNELRLFLDPGIPPSLTIHVGHLS